MVFSFGQDEARLKVEMAWVVLVVLVGQRRFTATNRLAPSSA